MIRFTPDACIWCPNKLRKTFDSEFYGEGFITDDQGTFYELPFWFCSDECVRRTLETYLEKRFHFGRSPFQDPDLPDDHIEEFVEDWNIRCFAAYEQAILKFRHRAVGEYAAWADKHNAEVDKEEEKIRTALEKERRQLETDRQKKLDQAKKEELQRQERDKRDARTALFDGIRLEDRDRNIQLQQQREADRQEDRTERKRLEAKREAWHDETREWRTEDRGWQLQQRDWQLQQRERSEKDRLESDTRESFERIFEQAGTDNQERDTSDLFTPKQIPPRLRYQHMHILGPTGAGKTTLLQHLILKDFKDYGADAAHVIIDPKGAMTKRLTMLKQFDDSWADRLVILDPLDRPAFNIFDARGQNPAQLISNIAYIFASHDQPLSGNQGTCLSFCASLLFRIPGANLRTLIELLEDRKDDPRFSTAIDSLSDDRDWALKRFFKNDYYNTYEANRQQIKTRINTILTEDNLAAMFNSRTCQVDIAQCIEEKKILLVNTQFPLLGDLHKTLGRFVITLFQQAVLTRKTEHPAFLVIDEFQEFADEQKTPQLLRLIREYNAGAILAHQNMVCAELTPNSQSAISTNTLIKFASSPGSDDRSRASKDLQCHPDFLTRVCVKNPDDSLFRFGCYFPGLKHPFVYQVGHDINAYQKITSDRYEHIRALNRAALADPPTTQKAPIQKEASSELQSSHGAEAHKPILPSPRQPTPSRPEPRQEAPNPRPRKPTVTLE